MPCFTLAETRIALLDDRARGRPLVEFALIEIGKIHIGDPDTCGLRRAGLGARLLKTMVVGDLVHWMLAPCWALHPIFADYLIASKITYVESA